MVKENTSPYICHVFVCTNDRGGTRKSCADGKSLLLRSALKREIKDHGWQGKVRVSKSGCMGLCGQGPNVMLYPQQIWFSDVSRDDLAEIIKRVDDIVQG